MRRKYGSYLELRGEQARRRSGSLKRSQRRPPGDPGSTATNRVIPPHARVIMGSDSLQAAKAKLRQAQRTTRATRDMDDQCRASGAVIRHLVAHFKGQNHLKVAAFMAVRGEIDLAALRGTLPELAWYIPKVVERDGPLLFGRWDPESLATGAFGIQEPLGLTARFGAGALAIAGDY